MVLLSRFLFFTFPQSVLREQTDTRQPVPIPPNICLRLSLDLHSLAIKHGDSALFLQIFCHLGWSRIGKRWGHGLGK